MRSGASKSRLHFIGDTHAASCPRMFVNMFQVIFRKHHASTDTLNRFGDKGCDLPGRGVVNQTFDVGGIMMASMRVVTAPRSAIGIRCDRMVHAEAVWHVELPRAMSCKSHPCVVSSVVRNSKRYHIVVLGVSARH